MKWCYMSAKRNTWRNVCLPLSLPMQLSFYFVQQSQLKASIKGKKSCNIRFSCAVSVAVIGKKTSLKEVRFFRDFICHEMLSVGEEEKKKKTRENNCAEARFHLFIYSLSDSIDFVLLCSVTVSIMTVRRFSSSLQLSNRQDKESAFVWVRKRGRWNQSNRMRRSNWKIQFLNKTVQRRKSVNKRNSQPESWSFTRVINIYFFFFPFTFSLAQSFLLLSDKSRSQALLMWIETPSEWREKLLTDEM